MYKAVIFDLDGTLLDTLQDLADSVNEMLEKYDMPKRDIGEIRQFVGNGMVKLVKRSVSRELDSDVFQEAYEFFRECYKRNMQNNTKPYDGIEECLLKLRQMGIKIVVTSNKNDDAVKNLCREFFDDKITECVGVSDKNPPKPNPKMVAFSIERLGLTSEECIFAGDSDTDIETAKNAGLKSIGVLWGFRDRDVLESAGADFIISSPQEITDIVK